MRKRIFLTILGLSLAQCSSELKDAPIPEATLPSVRQTSEPFLRTPSQALEVVQEMMFKSEFRTLGSGREVQRLVDLASIPELRSIKHSEEFLESFYAVEFKDNKGYALVSKDLRTFPIFAILDKGRPDAQHLNSAEMQSQTGKLMAGFRFEVAQYKKMTEQLRGNHDYARENSEDARQHFLNDGWRITREASPRLETTWGQIIMRPNLVMTAQGASYHNVYIVPEKEYKEPEIIKYAPLPSSAGCTPVAFGQVMYALRQEAGFRDLKYTSGEPVLWGEMDKTHSASSPEVQRFLGWFTMNCSPTRFGDETMVFNITATKFLRRILGEYILSRYDNCIVAEGDLDGYGWSESRRVADEFFQYPKCFVIMTASAGALDYISYHTFVIDGMIEYNKRIKGSGFLGTGLFKKWRDGVRHLYHVNAGWSGISNGYYLYVQSVNNEFKYTGSNNAMDYRSKAAYLIVRPK